MEFRLSSGFRFQYLPAQIIPCSWLTDYHTSRGSCVNLIRRCTAGVSLFFILSLTLSTSTLTFLHVGTGGSVSYDGMWKHHTLGMNPARDMWNAEFTWSLPRSFISLASDLPTARITLPYYCYMGRVLILSFIGIMFILFSREPGAGGWFLGVIPFYSCSLFKRRLLVLKSATFFL